jgi:hypothetical protein
MNLTKNTSVPALERTIGEWRTWKTEAYCENLTEHKNTLRWYYTDQAKCFTNQGSKLRRERCLSLLQNAQNGFGIRPVAYSTGTGDIFTDGRGTGVWC